MVRLAVLADIHGNLPALEATLKDIQRRGTPDVIWVLGDLVAFFPWLSDTIDRLRSLPDASVIQGNTDRYLVTGQRHAIPVQSMDDWEHFSQRVALRDKCFQWMIEQLRYEDYAYLRDLPHYLELKPPGFGRVMGVHAVPGNDEVEIWPDTPDQEVQGYLEGEDMQLLVFGHTHTSMQRRIGNIQLVNPGGVGFAYRNKPESYAAYALLEFSGSDCAVHLYQVDYDIDRVIKALQQSSYPGAKGLLKIFHRSTLDGSRKEIK